MMAAEQTKQMERLTAERQPFVVATVVRARRPTSVRPGDGAIVLADGTIEGFVGGVCAESSVRLHALRALETGEPLLLRLVPGAVEGEGGPPELAEGAVVEHNPCLSGGSLEIFIEPHLPANRIVVVGNSPIAQALVQLARAGDYDCSLGSPADAGRLEGAAAVVVASHGNGEEDVLSAALQAGVPYVALVASPKRGRVVRSELTVAPELAAQLHTPAGLDIGARTPSEIAISVLAEMVAVHHAHPGPIEVGQSREVDVHQAREADVNGAREADVNGAREADAHGALGISVSTPAITGVAIDPVCGMKVATVAASLHLDVDGETVWFCGEGCRASYQREHALG